MKNLKGTVTAVTLVLFGLFIFFSAGCDKYTQYKVLTFFFTGVPHPDDPEIPDSQKRQRGALTKDSKKDRRQRTQDLKSLAFTHGPFGAGQCHLCHQTASTAAFKVSDKKADKKANPKAIPTWEGGVPGKLVLPLKELCINCHPGKSVKSAYSKDLWIHGPVSDGLCTACHSPHQSPFQYMLLTDKSIDLCSKCHAKGFIIETEDHKTGKECTSCHNSHLGKSRFLLKNEFDETY